jgi:membrane-associated phospholipid phosphatase
MKKILAMFALLAALNSPVQAGDKHFEWIKPVDSAVTEAVAWDNTHLAAQISDYTQMTMTAAPFVYALTQDNRWQKLGVVAGVTTAVSGVTLLTKFLAERTRPNGQGTKSFFSGHTSASFTGAGLMCAQAHTAVCITSLVVASTTGYLRIAARKHWMSDVLVGAGIGFASGSLIPTLTVWF